jgi:hypothetical protein
MGFGKRNPVLISLIRLVHTHGLLPYHHLPGMDP